MGESTLGGESKHGWGAEGEGEAGSPLSRETDNRVLPLSYKFPLILAVVFGGELDLSLLMQ